MDRRDPAAYPLPSAALEEAGPDDQIFIRPGVYEDRLFVADRRILLTGAGRDHVEIFCRRGGPLYLQRVTGGRIAGITFRYVGSDQHSAVNILDSVCTLAGCRVRDGVLSSLVVYGPNCRPTLLDNEVCGSRESGLFVFAGACPYVAQNRCFGNHHFGIAVRDPGTRPDLVRNLCRENRLSGFLLFHLAAAMLLENESRDNDHWGLVATPDCTTTPALEELPESNRLEPNPLGALVVRPDPLAEIGR